MPPKAHDESSYTPEQMKQVLESALSPADTANSPLAYKSTIISPPKDTKSGHNSESSSGYDDNDQENRGRGIYIQERGTWHPCDRRQFRGDGNTPGDLITDVSTSDLRSRAMPENLASPPHGSSVASASTANGLPSIVPDNRAPSPRPSPVRLLNTPAPSRVALETPAQKFEVEAPFLQAMIGLLERQACIVPDHVLTRDEIKAIVRREIEKSQMTQDKGQEEKTIECFVTPSRMAGLIVGVAGIAVLHRAWVKCPRELMAWYVAAA